MEEIMDGIELLRRIRESKLKENTRLVDDYGNEYIYKRDEMGDLTLYIEENEETSIPDYSMFIDNKFEILLKKEEEIDIEEMMGVNAFKLMKSPYMADCLREGKFDIFMELLKQSELEFVDKIDEIVEALKQLNRKIKGD